MVEIYANIGWDKTLYTLQTRTFVVNENNDIDIYEIETRDWTHLYKIAAENRLGGDYIHIIVEHTGMMLRVHRFQS